MRILGVIRARITLEDLKENLVAAGPIGVRGRGELKAFLSFGVGPMGMKGKVFLSILVALKE